MPFDYLAALPIPDHLMPRKLRELLTLVGISDHEKVEVAVFSETDPDGDAEEHLHLQMAVVKSEHELPIRILDESSNGVVEYSVPFGDRHGAEENYLPSLSGHDYIVASWGDGSKYTFNLAEKVWMTLGLTPRCIGNEDQRIIYDNLSLPEFDVAEGETSATYQGRLSRNVCWTMSNEYLRRYLWMRGARGVRAFYYLCRLDDHPDLRALMHGDSHVILSPEEGTKWYELDLAEDDDGLSLQIWASVEAVTSEMCPKSDANGLIWPGHTEEMTFDRANALVGGDAVYIDDRFLERYEQNSFYDTTPVKVYRHWHCSPSYRGQWSFTDCRRVGRNLIRVPIRELYKPKPDREILHAFSYAVGPVEVASLALDQEHIVAKVERLVAALLDFGDGLSALSALAGIFKTPQDIVGLDRADITANGWLNYPKLSKLAQVAPIDISQQMFLARCKSLHEIWQSVPDGLLKQLLQAAGCEQQAVKNFGTIKLLQALLNIIESLNNEAEMSDAFVSDQPPAGWDLQNSALAPLFLNNDLRIADAHETVAKCLITLEDFGFDSSSINSGYGNALDFVMESVINSFKVINNAVARFVD